MALLSPQMMTGVMPWQTNDRKQLEGAIYSLAIQADYENRRWAQKWFEQHQFVLGNQSFKWSRQHDFAVDVDFLRARRGDNYQCQTNISRVVLESLASSIYSQLGELEFNTIDHATSRGRRLTKTLEGVGECYNERLGMHQEFDYGSNVLTLYSRVYGKIYWDKNAGFRFKRPKQAPVKQPKMTTRLETDPVTGEQMSVPCPVLDANGQPEMIDTYQTLVGPDGQPIYEWAPNGDAAIEMLTPYEVRAENARTFSRSKWIQQIRVMDYDDFMTEFASEPGAIDSEMRRVKGGIVSTTVRAMAYRHFLRAMFSSPPTLDFNGQMSMTSMLAMKNKILVIEHFDRPTEGHKYNQTPWLREGRRSVLANGRLVLVSTPQYRVPGCAIGWHPYFEARWLIVPPSAEATGPMSDTVAKNREVNMTDNMMSIAVKRTAGGQVLVNELSGLDKNKITGEPGMTHYVSGNPNEAYAIMSDKQPVPPSLVNYRQQQIDDTWLVSATDDSLRGERSVGATSGYQARIYEERAQKRISKAENNWHEFCAMAYKKLFHCIQQNASQMDPSVVARIMRSAQGDITESDVYDYLKGPMDFGVDVSMKYGSMRLKSHATKIADLYEAMKIPQVAEQLAADPSVLDKILDFLGLDMVRTLDADHRERARRENTWFYDVQHIREPEQLLAYGSDAPVVIWQDNDMAHLVEHMRDKVKNWDRYKKNPLVLSLHEAHCAWHEQNLKAKQNEQSPYIASTAPAMEQRAEQLGATPRNPLQELMQFRDQKAKEMAAQTAAATPAAKEGSNKGEGANEGEAKA